MCKMGGAIGTGAEKLRENISRIQRGEISGKNLGHTLDRDYHKFLDDFQGMGTQNYGKQLRTSMDKAFEGNIIDKQAWSLSGNMGGGGALFDAGDNTTTTNIEQSPTGSGKASGQDALDPAMLRIMNKMGKTDTKREMLTKDARKGPGLRLK